MVDDMVWIEHSDCSQVNPGFEELGEHFMSFCEVVTDDVTERQPDTVRQRGRHRRCGREAATHSAAARQKL